MFINIYGIIHAAKGGLNMAIKYYKLLDLMNKRGIAKGALQEMAGFSSATMAKISSNKAVSLKIISDICRALACQPGDILEYVEESEDAKDGAAQ